MWETLLAQDTPALEVRDWVIEERQLQFTLVSIAPAAACPSCDQLASRVHSRYPRTVADLPWAGRVVRLRLVVRRFFCDNPACEQAIFCERLRPAIEPYARRTQRLATCLSQLGFALGSKPGAACTGPLGLPVSPATLLRLVRATPLREAPTPRILGVDDWAIRKRQTYGTLLVDLERHCPVDLLPERSATALAAWLQAHPGVEIISRDRGKEYIEGSQQGAPQAVQVADRWHLLCNLGESVQRLLDRHPGVLRQATQRVTEANAARPAEDAPLVVASEPPAASAVVPLPPIPAPVSPGTAKAQQRYQAVKDLQAQGLAQREIARRLHLNRKTVRRYAVADECPPRAWGRQCISSVTPYRDYLVQRWNAGCRNGQQLWSELQAQGYTGSYGSVWRAVTRWVGKIGHGDQRATTPMPTPAHPLSARRAAWLLLRSRAELTPEDEQWRQALCAACSAAATAYPLVQAFNTMVRERHSAELDTWLAEASASTIAELRHFAEGLRQDLAAVRAALTLPWSSGQTEGQVNRLKTIKRAMYGRGKFDLLRLRVLYTPP